MIKNIIKNKLTKLLVLATLLLSAMPVFCSGILPYIKKRGKIYFLISQEAGGRDKYKWADFGGDSKRGESPRQAAAREAHEESGKIFGKFGGRKFWHRAITGQYGRHSFVADITHAVNKLGGKQAVLRKLRKTKGGGEKMNYLWISRQQLINPHRIPIIKGHKVKFRKYFYNKRRALARKAK